MLIRVCGPVQTLFNKLAIYLGNNLVRMVDRPDDPHCFRMQKNRSVSNLRSWAFYNATRAASLSVKRS